jgi:hypothetical protein
VLSDSGKVALWGDDEYSFCDYDSMMVQSCPSFPCVYDLAMEISLIFILPRSCHCATFSPSPTLFHVFLTFSHPPDTSPPLNNVPMRMWTKWIQFVTVLVPSQPEIQLQNLRLDPASSHPPPSVTAPSLPCEQGSRRSSSTRSSPKQEKVVNLLRPRPNRKGSSVIPTCL